MNIIKSRNHYYYLASPSVRVSDEDCNRCHISNKCGTPHFQSHYKACHIKKSQKVTNMIEAIALVETGLARIINEEGEKLQKRIALATNIKELISLDYSVKETLTNVIRI